MEKTTSFNPSSSTTKIQEKRLTAKRIFDLVVSLTVLTLGFPLILLIALLVAITSKGPIIYSHMRIGRGGKPFRIYKFRTMHQNADQHLQEYLSKNPDALTEWNNNYKLQRDPRVTSIGRFLRITSLDELPQFFNVLKGDLSIVGPRPVLKEEIDRFYGPIAHKVLSVRPGITGLWQVSGRSYLSYSDRVALDEEYVDRQSMWFDLKLLVKTIPAILRRHGAY